MGAVRVTCGRTIGRARSLFSTALATGGFLSAVALLFALRLAEAEGGVLSAVEVWTTCAAQILPLLASFLGMDVWCEERRSGRLDVLLSTAVRERDLVFGKFLGVWTVTCLTLFLSWASTAFLLWFCAPAAVEGIGVLVSLPALVGLSVQALLWCAVAVAASSMTVHSAVSLCLSVAATIGLPRGCWLGLMAWAPSGRFAFGPMPFDAHAVDMAAGVFPVGVLFGYLSCAAVALFICAKSVASVRLRGRGVSGLRVSTASAIVLSLGVAVLSVSLASAVDLALEMPMPDPTA